MTCRISFPERVKLIALDLDGTLLDETGRIPPANARALRAWAERGVIIALSSGRMTDCIAPTAAALGIDCPIVAYNGAMVRDRISACRRMIFHGPIEPEYGDYLIDYCAERRFLLNYYLDDVLYAEGNPSLRRFADLYAAQTGAQYHFLENLQCLKGHAPTKLILLADPVHPDPLRTRNGQYGYLRTILGDAVSMVRTNPEYLEFLRLGVNKGVGLEYLAGAYGIPREEVVAFGDGENDREMLTYAGLGVAPANATESVREAADIVLPWTNSEAAVARFLDVLCSRRSGSGSVPSG